MQGIYTYIPETNCVPWEYSVAAILLLLFTVLISLVPVLNLLYFYISTFRSICAVPNMAVFYYFYYYYTISYMLRSFLGPHHLAHYYILYVHKLHFLMITRLGFKQFSSCICFSRMMA